MISFFDAFSNRTLPVIIMPFKNSKKEHLVDQLFQELEILTKSQINVGITSCLPLHSPHLFLFFIFPLSPSVPLEWVRPRVEGVEDEEEE